MHYHRRDDRCEDAALDAIFAKRAQTASGGKILASYARRKSFRGCSATLLLQIARRRVQRIAASPLHNPTEDHGTATAIGMVHPGCHRGDGDPRAATIRDGPGRPRRRDRRGRLVVQELRPTHRAVPTYHAICVLVAHEAARILVGARDTGHVRTRLCSTAVAHDLGRLAVFVFMLTTKEAYFHLFLASARRHSKMRTTAGVGYRRS